MAETITMAENEQREHKSDILQLKVVAQDGTEIHFKCKPKTPLKKLMDAYCVRQGVKGNEVRFCFDGERIRESQMPQDLEMEDGDVIDVFVESVGGWAVGRLGG